jgi:REP element-mobilizing transposase RayT
VERYDIRVHGFVLMPNHYHLMIESVRGNLSDAMKMLASRYVQEMNRRPGWDGSLFRGRFHSKLVYEDRHWRHLLAYLHLNPVKAGLAVTPSQYQWSSHGKYTGELTWPDWLVTKSLKSRLGGIGYQKFIERVMNGSMPAPDGFGEVLYGRRRSQRPIVLKQETSEPSLTKEEALAQVSRLTGVAGEHLLRSTRGRGGNAPRALALWWLIHGAGLSNVEVSGVLGISPSGISKILAQIRGGKRTYQEGNIARWIEQLKAGVEK